tara:strand:+ start:91 stop:750 length:660 start_codon:yes stop_codon:yes gene_type:complete
MPIKIVPKNETAVQKRERIRQEQKKRFEQRQKQKMMTGGLDDPNVKSPKKSPAAMKEQKRKADIRKKNKATLGSIFDRFIAGPKLKKKKLGKVDVGLSEAMKKKRPTGMSPGALGGKAKPKAKTFRDYKTIAAAKKAGSLYYMGKDGKKKAAVTKADLDKSGLSLRDYLNFMTGKTRKSAKKPMTKTKTVLSGGAKGGPVKKLSRTGPTKMGRKNTRMM